MPGEWAEPELPLELGELPQLPPMTRAQRSGSVQYRWIKTPNNKCDVCMTLYALGTPPQHGAQMERYVRYQKGQPSIRLCYLHHAQYREAEK